MYYRRHIASRKVSRSKKAIENFTFYPPQNAPLRYQKPLADGYPARIGVSITSTDEQPLRSCGMRVSPEDIQAIPWCSETNRALEDHLDNPLGGLLAGVDTRFIYIFYGDIANPSRTFARSRGHKAEIVPGSSDAPRDLMGKLRDMVVMLQISPECFEMIESFSSHRNFYTTSSVQLIPRTSGTVWEMRETFVNGPGFQICYTLFFNLSSDGNSGMRKVVICNNYSSDLESSWFFMSDSLSFGSFLASDTLRRQLRGTRTQQWENTLNLHTAFCTLATVGWQEYILELRSRLNSITDLPTHRSSLPETRELLQIEAEIAEALELLTSNKDSLNYIDEFLTDFSQENDDGYDKDNLHKSSEEFRDLHRTLFQYTVDIGHLIRRAKEKREAMILLLSISREEKSYETSVNHLKVSFLSQNFNRGLGFAIMLFIPGIFASTLFSSQFFYFTDSGIISASRGIWVWIVIVVPLSLLTYWVLIVSFHTQLGQPLWTILRGYIIKILWFLPLSRRRDLELGDDSMSTELEDIQLQDRSTGRFSRLKTKGKNLD